VIWSFSTAITALQFATLTTAPLADPKLELSAYHTPDYQMRDLEIFGWYWIDWGPSYYKKDFQKAKDMYIDGVFLLSNKYTFLNNSTVFKEAVISAQLFGLRVGIVIFHPYDADFQKIWNLPVEQGKFADFSANRSWIEEIYTSKLKSLVNIGDFLNITYYVYDNMTFDKTSNLTNAQLFIDITNKITHGRAIMLARYPPKNMTLLTLSIKHWDWRTAPEDVRSIRNSLEKRPLNNTSVGQFVWLHKRTDIDFESLSAVYNVLSNSDRIEIFTLRYGEPNWTNAIGNSILEHPTLIEYLSSLNLQVKKRENSPGYIMFSDYASNKIALDLSKSVFINPLSVCENGQTAEYGTNIGASYFSVKESQIGQRMIEMRFCGNGTNGVSGWFAYRVRLKNPIPINENSTLLLLLRLNPSIDGTAWTWYRIDFSTKEDDTYSLIWSFHDVPMNYVTKKGNDTKCRFDIGSVINWKFYQFSLYDVFYTYFSKKPLYITGVRYAIGAECDNDITAQFLLAKISSQPFEINNIKIRNVKPGVNLTDGEMLSMRGLHFRKVLVVSKIFPKSKTVNYQLALLGLAKTEFYGWNLGGFSNATQIKGHLSFNISSQASKFFLMDEEISSDILQQKTCTLELNLAYNKVTFITLSEIESHFVPLVILIPLTILLAYMVSKIIKVLKFSGHLLAKYY
jgi:hypothetical protein